MDLCKFLWINILEYPASDCSLIFRFFCLTLNSRFPSRLWPYNHLAHWARIWRTHFPWSIACWAHLCFRLSLCRITTLPRFFVQYMPISSIFKCIMSSENNCINRSSGLFYYSLISGTSLSVISASPFQQILPRHKGLWSIHGHPMAGGHPPDTKGDHTLSWCCEDVSFYLWIILSQTLGPGLLHVWESLI